MNNLVEEIFSFFSKQFATVNSEKKHIRQDIRSLKRLISDEQKQLDASVVFDRIEALPEFKTAEIVLFYWAIADELPTQNAIDKWSTNKQILLPSVVEDKLYLKRYSPNGKMIQRNLGIWEPDLIETYNGNVDLIIVPGIAFDRRKNRLGRGKGYYDRFFKKYKPTKIGVGFDFQLMDKVPTKKHDIKMDIVVTPSEIIK